MSTKIDIQVPFPPSVNTVWRKMGGRMVVSAKAREFYHATNAILVGFPKLGKARVAIEISLSSPTKRKYDIDNRAKCVLDCLVKSQTIDDDEQVDVLTIRRLEPCGDVCFVSVTVLEEVNG